MLKIQRELCKFSPLPALFSINMDDARMFHFQQDYLGCVDDEANIVKKCDARRQGNSENISSSLSRWLDRLKSYMMTARYVINTTTLLMIRVSCICFHRYLPSLVSICTKQGDVYNDYKDSIACSIYAPFQINLITIKCCFNV